jgi:hypothetical protein
MEQPRLTLVGSPASPGVKVLQRTFASLGFACACKGTDETLKLLLPEATVSGFSDILRTFNSRLRAVDRQSDDCILLAESIVHESSTAEAKTKFLEQAENHLRDGRTYLGGVKPGVGDIALSELAGHIPDRGSIGSKVRNLIVMLDKVLPVPQNHAQVPSSKKTITEMLLGTAWLVRGVARLAARFAPPVVKLGNRVFVFRWSDVATVFDHDGAFRIAPVNGARIEAVSGPFILGMDRSDHLFQQRHQLYSALNAVSMADVRRVMEVEADTLITAALSRFGKIDVVNSYARLVAGRVARRPVWNFRAN